MNQPTGLTAFKPGSLRELMKIAFPLILVALSENIMIFFDRIILSHYSLSSLNATTLASQAVEIFQYAIWAITGMSEIFVARLFAQEETGKYATPSWQMIYLSLMTIPVVILLSLYTGPLILPNDYLNAGLGYYQIFLYSVPLTGMIAALAGFFVGQGKTKLVLQSTVVINLINLALDIVFIFGVHGIIPALGASGAAISAIVSLSIQVIWLAIIFLNKSNRINFRTWDYQFNTHYFRKSIRIGLPLALNHILDLVGWFYLIKLIATTNVINFTIISIGSTLYLIYACIADGLFRALSALISYHIGAKQSKTMHATLRSGFIFLAISLTILGVPVILQPDLILHLFNLKITVPRWHDDIKTALIFMWLYFFGFGIYWLFGALLTAKYRTKALTVINASSLYLVTILPISLIVYYSTLQPQYIWPIISLSAVISCIATFIYYVKTR